MDINKVEALFNEVHKFFIDTDNLKPIKIEVKKDEIKNKEDIINLFRIEKSEDPIYKDITCLEDAYKAIDSIIKYTNEYKESIASTLRGFDDINDENTNIALSGIFSAISNFEKVLNKQIRKGIDEELDEDEIKEKLASNLIKLLDQRLIRNVVKPLYEGIKYNDCEVYRVVIEKTNIYIKSYGIYTINLEVNGDFDYDFIEPQEASNNITDDYRLEEKIKEIHQYPYIFDEDNIVSQGKIVVWRKG